MRLIVCKIIISQSVSYKVFIKAVGNLHNSKTLWRDLQVYDAAVI